MENLSNQLIQKGWDLSGDLIPDIDFMIGMEVGVMNILFKRAGIEVDIATTSGQRLLGPTQKIEKVLRLADVKSTDYVGVIMPSMAVGVFPGGTGIS